MTQTPILPEEEESLESISQFKDWDVAIRYQKLQSQAKNKKLKDQIKKVSIYSILERAKSVLHSVSRPTQVFTKEWSPGDFDGEINLEETLEARVSQDKIIYIDKKIARTQPVNICVDTSLSMTGEKLALTAVALAVVILQFPEDDIGMVAFENEAKILKQPQEKIGIEVLIERFLDCPAQGYTHLEKGLREAIQMQNRSRRLKKPVTILMTDGKYTAGRDPAFLGPQFYRLEIIKMGNEKSPLSLCRELATLGHGSVREVSELYHLPQVMYSVVRDILRGGQIRPLSFASENAKNKS